jgi:tetratricopeptide (TPR) repeat protein
LAPKVAESYLLLADLFLKRGMTERAIESVDRLGRALPEEPLGFRRLGLLLAEKGDGARAERLLKKAVERDPADLESWATLGHIYESTARLGQALAAWERAAQCDPENAEVLFAAGRVALRLGRPDDARATFDRLLTRAGDPETSIRVALSYLAGRQPERALEVLDRVRRASSEPRIEYLAGIVSERLGRLETAAEAFERVAQDEGDLARQARLHLASCLSGLGRHQSALGEFERLAAQSPELPGLRVPYARALERSGQASRAEAELVRELDRTASSEVAEALTQFYRRQGRLDEAVRQLRAARTRRPEDHELRLALAVALDKSGDWHSAIDELRAHTSDSPAAANFVGYSLASRGLELQLATRLVQKALSAEPEDSAFLDSMGWVWLKRGDPRRALRYLLKALDAAPEEPTLLEHLGEVLSRLGRRGEARVFFRRAAEQLDLNPDAAERPGQRAEIDERLKALEASAR